MPRPRLVWKEVLFALVVFLATRTTEASTRYHSAAASEGQTGYVQIQETGKPYDAATVQIKDPSQSHAQSGQQSQYHERMKQFSQSHGFSSQHSQSESSEKRAGQSFSVKLEYTDEQRLQHRQSQIDAGGTAHGGGAVGGTHRGGRGGALAAARRQIEEERRRQEEERNIQEEERRRQDEERRRLEEERNQGEEVRRLQVEERRREDAERRRLEEERNQGEEDRRHQEEERRRQEEERRQQVEERRRLEDERSQEEERRRQIEETRRVAAETGNRQDMEEARRRQLVEERLRAEEERKRLDRERQERIEEERRVRLERQRQIEAQRSTIQGQGRTVPTQTPGPTPAARTHGRDSRHEMLRNRCTDCNVGNQTFRGHSRFEYEENCHKYRCICHCDGSHDCPSHHTVNVCERRTQQQTRRVSSTCKTCDAKGKIVQGNNYFDLQDGCILYRDCKCFCNGSWECSTNRTENTCVQKVGQGSCSECEVYGSFHPGNSRFTYQEGCYEYNCDCNCDGSYNCPPDRTKDICRKGCGECEIQGEFFEGNTYFTQERGCLEYTCFCNCNGSWNCPGDRVKDTCEPDDSDRKCSQCQVTETEVYEGNSTFQLRKKCINYECSCKCDGSWDCPGILARNICRGERPGGCKSCQVSDEEFYPGDSDFDMRKECIHYKCRCNCDGSWNCPGEIARDVCKGEVPGGCKSCKLSETEYYRGETDFEMRRDCIQYQCHCNCDGSWNCPGAAARNVCRGEIPGGCRSCEMTDRTVYPANSRFRYVEGCLAMECRCMCNGTAVCDERASVNVCTTRTPTIRPRQRPDSRRTGYISSRSGQASSRSGQSSSSRNSQSSSRTSQSSSRTSQTLQRSGQSSNSGQSSHRTVQTVRNENCQKCMVEGNDYAGNTNFKLKRGCYVYPCQCDCNGRWGCKQNEATNICSDTSSQRGSNVGQRTCQRCAVQGRMYPGDSEFRIRRGCISYKCKCACDGRWECPSDKASNFCPGSREPTQGCKQCEVDGQSYTVGNNFDMRRGCVRYKCKCRCDGSYGCHVTQDNACTIGESPAVCGNCEINSYVYPGNMGFFVRDGCTQMECSCFCNGTYNCPDENKVDICRNKQLSRFLKDGTFTSTGSLGEQFGSGTQVFNQGGQQYTVTRRKYGGPGARQYGSVGNPVQPNQQFLLPGRPVGPVGPVGPGVPGVPGVPGGPGSPYVVRGRIPLGGALKPGQIVTHNGQQYILRGFRQYVVPGGVQYGSIPGGAIPQSVQRNFYNQLVNHPFGPGTGGSGSSDSQRSHYSYSQYDSTGARTRAGVQEEGGAGVPTYNVRTARTNASTSVHTSGFNRGGANDTRTYGSAVFHVKAPYTPGRSSVYRHVGQVAVNPKPGCGECKVEGKAYRGGSQFQITKECVQFNCNCECSGSWTCSGEYSSQCGQAPPDAHPQGDSAGTCKRCHVNGNSFAGRTTFPLVQNCSEYTCTCDCTGKWYCPAQKPKDLCGRSRGELRESRGSTCQMCDVRGTDYPPHADFLLRDNCVQYKCTCNCDGSWECPNAERVNVCEQDREKERREREEAARAQKLTTRLPQSWGPLFTTRVPYDRAANTRYSNTRNGIAYKQTSCQSCVIKGKSYIPENEFKFREGCSQYKCHCFCNGTWDCPAEDTINLCRNQHSRRDDCKECSVKNETHPGGRPFKYREGCWEFNCFCGCNGEHSCPANRTTDVCKKSGSVSPKCKPCMIDGKVMSPKSNFNMRRGCTEFLCDCNCDGTWTCPEDRSINICQGEGKTARPDYKLKGCVVGNRTFYTRLFAYTEDCVRYMCICYDNGAWKCPPEKSRKVC